MMIRKSEPGELVAPHSAHTATMQALHQIIIDLGLSLIFKQSETLPPPHSREGFLELHDRAVESLTKHWNREEGVSGKELEFPYSHKLVDLFFKFSARHEDLNQDIRRLIVNFSNTPIDKFSLQLLQACYCGIIISPKPAMGDISRLEDYRFLQNLIQELMADLNLPASYFDYTAWEPFH